MCVIERPAITLTEARYVEQHTAPDDSVLDPPVYAYPRATGLELVARCAVVIAELGVRHMPEPVDVARALEEEAVEVVVQMVRPVLDDLVRHGNAVRRGRRIKRSNRMVEVERLPPPYELRGFANARVSQEIERAELVRRTKEPPRRASWRVVAVEERVVRPAVGLLDRRRQAATGAVKP